MIQEKLTINGRNYNSSTGCFGTYIQISKDRGLKTWRDRSYRVFEQNDKDRWESHLRREGKFLRCLNRVTKLFPKFYKFVYVSQDGVTKLAILMEHFDGKQYCDLPSAERNTSSVCSTLNKLGISWEDAHNGNMIKLTTGKHKAIDADRRQFCLRAKFKHLVKVKLRQARKKLHKQIRAKSLPKSYLTK